MRPLKLTMKAFGAYAGTVALDFQTGLNGNNFFLIHGATGSGKTTILDAICYALYGKASGNDRNSKMMRSDRADENFKSEVNFEFALNDKIFKIYRNLNENVAEVYVDGVLKTDGLRNVNKFVTEQIGFSDEQFRQVVILPQGNFKKFLSANAREKAELLSEIFDAAVYKLVEETLKNKFNESKAECATLTNNLEFLLNEARRFGELKTVSDIPALLEKIGDDLNRAKTLRGECEIKLRDAQKNLTAGELLNKIFADRDTFAKNLQSAKDALAVINKNLNAAQIEFDKRKAEESTRRDIDNKISKLKEIQAAVVELKNRQDALTKANAAEKAAKDNLDKVDAEHKRYVKLLEKLRRDEKSLQNAKVEFTKAEGDLNKAKDRDACVKEISQLQNKLAAANKNLAEVDGKLKSANVNLERLNLLQKNGTAAKLATTLVDGEPCPVCGATTHPQPAISDDAIPSDDEISNAEKLLKQLQREKEIAAGNVARINGELKTKQDALKKFDGVLELAEVKKIFDAAKLSVTKLNETRQRVKNGEVCVDKKFAELEAARRDSDTKTKLAANLRGVVEEKQKQIPAEYAESADKITQDLSALQKSKRELETAWKVADENFHRLNNQKAAQVGKLQAAEKSLNDAVAKVDGKIQPNIAELKNNVDAAQKSNNEAVSAVTTLTNNLSQLEKNFGEMKILTTQIESAEKLLHMWKNLSNVANGVTGTTTFQRYYLSAMFQEVIVEANVRLDKMSGGRFQFRGNRNALDRHTSKGLEFEIHDAYTGKARPVESLSGGESFLASLSLALGLAAVVQKSSGGLKLDTIFIDEGFGSLDSETLDNAINTLNELQDGGRLVGIISHVDELKNRVPVRLEVVKGKFGSSAKFVS